ncbi:restriction endonuclease [Uliginosibacterium sp. H3]|uniref:Restriction endonuclease n=1 Tax=Uliginosibacterium silvisoli TaxID=3114758 RepID=A0ABU6K623_9RHOO|nr:restriction endonuclease [Uliginosibacterium sp. H3]
MSRDVSESGLSGLIFGERWQAAAGRALAIFVLAYVLPTALMAPTSGLTAFLRLLATVLSFVLAAGAIYKLLQVRAQETRVEEEESFTRMAPVATSSSAKVKAGAEAGVQEFAEPELAPPPAIDALGQIPLERLCMALYQFNGLHSKTVATGADGEYRIRLVPRNTDKPIAILQCRAGSAQQGTQAYAALLRVMEDDGLEKAFFVAPAGFDPAIAAEARARHVTLVDLKLLQAMIDRLPDGARDTVFSAAR